jgi:hypothetical protein
MRKCSASFFLQQSGKAGVERENALEGIFMKTGFVNFFKKKFAGEQLHPLDRGAARQWIKRRLKAVFPELRHDPAALERAYRDLSLEPRAGGIGDMQTYYEVVSPGI